MNLRLKPKRPRPKQSRQTISLTRNDFDRILKFLENLYRPDRLDEHRDHLLAGLEELVPNLGHAWGVADFQRSDFGGRSANLPEFTTPQLQASCFRHAAEHPVHKYYFQTGKSQFVSTDDVETFSSFKKTGFYNEICRPLNVEDGCGMVFPTAAGSSFIIGVLSDREFNRREKGLLNAVSTHVMQAHYNAERLTAVTNHSNLLDSALNRLGRGVLILDRGYNLTFATDCATRFLCAYFDGSQQRSMPEPLLNWVKSGATGLRGATDLPAPLAPLIVRRAGRRLVARLFTEPDHYLVTFEEQIDEIQPSALLSLGLTPRQAEVLSYVAMGKTNPEIGTILGMSPRTVEKHIEQILLRLAVENRTAAVATAFEAAHTSWSR
jgi:DNA-binding CsgD family transcriptional regulator